MVRGWRRVTAMLAAAVFLGWSGGARAVDIATVALTGEVAPGTGGATFSALKEPVVNGAGAVAFSGDLTGGGVTSDNDRGVWAGRPGALALVAREDDPAPGAGGAKFLFFDEFDPVLNGAGEVAFLAGLAGRGTNAGIWVGKPGALTLVARAGDRAPGTGGRVFSSFRAPVLNGSGEVAFYANLRGARWGIWAGKPGALALVARRGDRAPGTGGAIFDDFEGPVLNGAGEVAFFADVDDVNNNGIWAGKPGAIALVARAGNPAPGAGKAVFDSFFRDDLMLNGAGEVAFAARIEGRGAKKANYEGIWAGKPGGLVLVARKGDPAPGIDGAFFDFLTSPVLNGAGQVVFRASLTGSGANRPNNTGIWAGKPGRLALVARRGDPAPGTGNAFARYTLPLLNGTGELAFNGRVRGSGTTSDNDEGFWAGVPGDLQLIVREGDDIEVAPADLRTVADDGIGFTATAFASAASGNEDGRTSGFSEGGQVVFRADFTDSTSGIFLSPPDVPKVHPMPARAINGSWQQVILPRSLKRPVIIAGPPGYNNKQPGVIRLRKVQGAKGRFQARFQEWRYLDGKHPEERTDFLALEQGRHVLADGSIWEAGTVDVRGIRNWRRQSFTPPLPGVPQVFATVQQFRDKAPVAVRVRNVTASGFEASVQEEETNLRNKHNFKRTVGYLAVYSASGQGTIAGGVDGADYRLKQAEVNHRFKRVLGERIKLQEEESKDKETKHEKETVSVMTVGRGLFTQQASDRERDTTAIRRR